MPNARVCCLFLLLSLTACVRETVSDTQPLSERIPVDIPTPELDLGTWPAPAQLGSFALQGEVHLAHRHLRILRYSRPAGEQTQQLELQLTPIPGGWEDMTPSRLVAGHYGPLRQHLGERALERGALEVWVEQEGAEAEPTMPQPVATGEVWVQYPTRRAVTLLSVTALPPVFVSATVTGRPEQAQALADAQREALLDYAAATAATAQD